MNYIIFDVEFNHSFEKNRDNEILLPFEIIQIGAVKLNRDLNQIATFNKLIKPTYYNTIHPYIKELTGIVEADLRNVEDFKVVFSEFLEFIGDEPYITCTWGNSDIKELYKNIKFHNIKSFPYPQSYIDIQEGASKYFRLKRGQKIGLKRAVTNLNLTSSEDFHNAFKDALYTSKVFKKLPKEIFKIKLFNPIRNPRNPQNKGQVDYDKLYAQFNKMLNRELSQEEKKIVKLAYIMGRTNQFVINENIRKED